MKTNYIACMGLTVFRILDIILTSIILSLGYAELNPLGFNTLSISLVLIWTAGMWLISYYIKEKEPYQSILFLIIIMFTIISAVVVGYQIRILM